MFALKLVLWIIAYTAGIGRLSLAVILLARKKRVSDIWNVVFLFIFAICILALTNVDTIFSLKGDGSYLFGIVAAYCGALLVLAIPLYTHYSLTAITRLQFRNGIFIGLGSLCVLLNTFSMLIPEAHLFGYVLFFTLFIMALAIIYSMVITLIAGKGRPKKPAEILLPVLVIILIPFMVYFDFVRNFAGGYVVLPVLYLVVNIMMMIIEADEFKSGPKSNHLSKDRMQALDLTEREQEVAGCLLEGLTYSQTADKLCISPQTVKTHANRIYTKTDSRNKLDLLNKIREQK